MASRAHDYYSNTCTHAHCESPGTWDRSTQARERLETGSFQHLPTRCSTSVSRGCCAIASSSKTSKCQSRSVHIQLSCNCPSWTLIVCSRMPNNKTKRSNNGNTNGHQRNPSSASSASSDKQTHPFSDSGKRETMTSRIPTYNSPHKHGLWSIDHGKHVPRSQTSGTSGLASSASCHHALHQMPGLPDHIRTLHSFHNLHNHALDANR